MPTTSTSTKILSVALPQVVILTGDFIPLKTEKGLCHGHIGDLGIASAKIEINGNNLPFWYFAVIGSDGRAYSLQIAVPAEDMTLEDAAAYFFEKYPLAEYGSVLIQFSEGQYTATLQKIHNA